MVCASTKAPFNFRAVLFGSDFQGKSALEQSTVHKPHSVSSTPLDRTVHRPKSQILPLSPSSSRDGMTERTSPVVLCRSNVASPYPFSIHEQALHELPFSRERCEQTSSESARSVFMHSTRSSGNSIVVITPAVLVHLTLSTCGFFRVPKFPDETGHTSHLTRR